MLSRKNILAYEFQMAKRQKPSWMSLVKAELQVFTNYDIDFKGIALCLAVVKRQVWLEEKRTAVSANL